MTQCSVCEALTSKNFYVSREENFYYCDDQCKEKIIDIVEYGEIISD